MLGGITGELGRSSVVWWEGALRGNTADGFVWSNRAGLFALRGQADGQTDRRTDGQTDRQKDRQTDRQAGRHVYKKVSQNVQMCDST